MHILVITHVDFYSIYGAATSLRHHVQLIQERTDSNAIKITVVNRVSFTKYLKSFIKGNSTNLKNKKSNFKIIDLWSLPFENNYDGHPEDTGKKGAVIKIKKSIQFLLYTASLQKIVKLIRKENITVLHLNASVLAPVGRDIRQSLGSDCPLIVMHIRDFVKKSINFNQIQDIDNADRFICIDKSSYNRLIEVASERIRQKAIILQNLFIRNKLEKLAHITKLNKPGSVIQYVIVGRISELKGVMFVLNAFLKADVVNSMLYIVGNGEGEYFEKVLAKCKEYPKKITHLPEFANLSESDLYYKADFLVRGDETFRTGRTVYEALTYNTRIVLPGNFEDLNEDEDLKPFKDKIFLYKASDEAALINIFRDTGSIRLEKTSAPDPIFERKSDLYYTEVIKIYHSDYRKEAQI